jgi:hypothetical protein
LNEVKLSLGFPKTAIQGAMPRMPLALASARQARGMAAEANLAGIGGGDAHGREARGMAAEADLAGIGNRGPTKGDRLHGRKLLHIHFTHFTIS